MLGKSSRSKNNPFWKSKSIQMFCVVVSVALLSVTVLFAQTQQNFQGLAHHGDDWTAAGRCTDPVKNTGVITISSSMEHLGVTEARVLVDGYYVGMAAGTGETTFGKIPDPSDPTNLSKSQEIKAGVHTILVEAGDSLPKTETIDCGGFQATPTPTPSPTPVVSALKLTAACSRLPAQYATWKVTNTTSRRISYTWSISQKTITVLYRGRGVVEAGGTIQFATNILKNGDVLSLYAESRLQDSQTSATVTCKYRR